MAYITFENNLYALAAIMDNKTPIKYAIQPAGEWKQLSKQSFEPENMMSNEHEMYVPSIFMLNKDVIDDNNGNDTNNTSGFIIVRKIFVTLDENSNKVSIFLLRNA